VAECDAVPVVAFVGRSGCGKTTLLTGLIGALARRGVHVGVIKHSPVHNVVSDLPGTDSYRFWEAGARHVGLVSANRVVHTHRYQREPDLAVALADVIDVDLILLEGYKRSSVDKVEVLRASCTPVPITGLVGRVAYVTDVELSTAECPVFGLGELDRIADFLVLRYLGR
jgi:molybdopterin-guanine dinucleotide biosynthesis protein MobB